MLALIVLIKLPGQEIAVGRTVTGLGMLVNQSLHGQSLSGACIVGCPNLLELVPITRQCPVHHVLKN